MQQLFLQKCAQQQPQEHRNVQPHHQQHLQQCRSQQNQHHHDGNGQFSASDQDILLATDAPVRKNSAAAIFLSAKIYEERMKIPAQTEALDETVMKVISQLHTTLLKYLRFII
jgi:hypothetical protein